MNYYHAQDADQDWRERQIEMQQAVEDYHLEVFVADPPQGCDSRCGWKDPWGACVKDQRWPTCDLERFCREERILP